MPDVVKAKALIDDGFIGTPFIFNGYEQNSQWLDPLNPLRQVDPDADQSVIQVSSLEGYGAPIIDIGAWVVGAPYQEVVGTMRNFIPERMVRATGRMMRMNIDDGDIFIGEFANGALGSIQTSFVTVGNYPGIEARVYGMPLLAALQARQHWLAVATGKSRHGLDEALQAVELRGVFHASRTADETAGKPHPLMLMELMGELGTEPARTLMIGDTTHDLQMALNAGCAGVGVSYGAHEPDGFAVLNPRYVAHSVADLHTWLADNA